MNLNYLYYFRILAEKQHYAETAELLHTTPSKLSYAMSALEKELGVQLFEKKGRNVKLTKNGEVFSRRVNNAIQELESGIMEMRERSDYLEQTIRISSARIFFVNSVIDKFFKQERFRNIHLQIHQSKTTNIINDLKDGKIDLGFCAYRTNDTDMVFIPALRQQLIALIPPEHKLYGTSTLDLEDLTDRAVIIPRGMDGMYAQVTQYFQDNNYVPIRKCEADSSNSAAMLALSENVIAITIENPMFQHLNLSVVPIVSPPSNLYIYLAYIKNRWYSEATVEFISYIKERSC